MKKSHIKKLDTLWSKAIKKIAGYKCEFCLEENVWLNSCHIIGRACRTTRWDLDNGMCLCFLHHREYDTHQPNHEKIRRIVIGEKRIERLVKKKRVIAKNQDYQEIKTYLEEALCVL